MLCVVFGVGYVKRLGRCISWLVCFMTFEAR